MSQEYSERPMTTVYVPRVHFMYQKYSLCPKSAVYVPRLQFISHDYKFMSLELSLCP